MRRLRHEFRVCLVAMGAALLALFATGCATTDTETENVSERPWNAPKSWENGLPSQMFEGR